VSLLRKKARRVLANARTNLGEDLSGYSPVDLLLDKIPSLQNSQEARMLLHSIEPKKLPRKSQVELEVTCDFCGARPSVIIDAPTNFCGSWAHQCRDCFQQQGIEGVGTTHKNKESSSC